MPSILYAGEITRVGGAVPATHRKLVWLVVREYQWIDEGSADGAWRSADVLGIVRAASPSGAFQALREYSPGVNRLLARCARSRVVVSPIESARGRGTPTNEYTVPGLIDAEGTPVPVVTSY